MSKMNPEIKAQWVAALRSGKYKQTRGYLRVNGGEGACDGFCCYGVLCDLNNPNGWKPRHGSLAGVQAFEGPPGSGCAATLLPPRAVCDWAGFTRAGDPFGAPSVSIGGSIKRSLADHNDEGMTFAQIADAIEEQL